MEVISFYKSGRQQHWLKEIERCDWGAGTYILELLSKGKFFETLGESSEFLMLTDGDELISFCTFAERDDIPGTVLSPWVGFVYTYPKHRGHRYVGLLFDEAERLAKVRGISQVYISTGHVGLYEKYGCEYLTDMRDMRGEMSRVYVKRWDK